MLTLHALNHATQAEFMALLDGVYEGSPWVAERAWHRRPFVSAAALKHALASVVRDAAEEEQCALLRAHPELGTGAPLGADSAREQRRAGVEAGAGGLEALERLNATYFAAFGWPFIVAVGGPRAQGLARHEIVAALERRLSNPRDVEHEESLRQVHRIAELRLAQRFGTVPELGNRVWDWAEQLARHSERDDALTVTYLSDAHRACARQLHDWMAEVGFDEVSVDAVGNVVGVYWSAARARQAAADPAAEARAGSAAGPDPAAPERECRLLTGSHYDTVRNGGRYDGRLGILVPMACVGELRRAGRRLPFGIEVVGFAEEEGQRYPCAFLGSAALTGRFDPAWLELADADGVTLGDAMRRAGLAVDGIASIARDPSRYLGFVEIHIEQGPVLSGLDLPLGVVTSINGGLRYRCETVGLASHAGTTPMGRRRDAAAAAAELVLYVERRAGEQRGAVGTVGLLEVPNGSINVVPGRCRFSLDLRAGDDAARDALAADVHAALKGICERRGVAYTLDETMRAAAAPSAPAWQRRWERAVEALGLPVFRLPSGAGHDAMKLHEVMPQAMLFVRGGNAGISHNPLETVTSDDADLAARALLALLDGLADEGRPG